MWSFVTQSGLPSVVLDLTNDLAWLGIGLFALVALSAGSIVYMAIRHHFSQNATSTTETALTDYRKAA